MLNSPYRNNSSSTAFHKLYVRGGNVAGVSARIFAIKIVRLLLRQNSDHWLIVYGNGVDLFRDNFATICERHKPVDCGDEEKFRHFSETTCCDCDERLENTKDLFTEAGTDDNACLSSRSQLIVTCVQLSARTTLFVASLCSLYGDAAILVINVTRSIPSLPFDYTEREVYARRLHIFPNNKSAPPNHFLPLLIKAT